MRTWPLSRSDVVRNVESGAQDMVRTMAWGVGPGGKGSGAGRGEQWGWGWGPGRRQRLSGQRGARS